MRFTLQTLLLTFVFVWSSMAFFGAFRGVFIAAVMLGFVAVVRSAKTRGDAIVRAVWLILILGCAGVFLLPAIEAPRIYTRRAACLNNLKQLGSALLHYHDVFDCFPPAFVPDKDGKPMHSWRVLILPFIEHQTLYEQYDFGQPWNTTVNRQLTQKGTPYRLFQCPSDPRYWRSELTNYVAVVGPETAWPSDKCAKLEDVKDGARNTILLIELINSDIHWAEPRDLTFKEASRGIDSEANTAISSAHPISNGPFYHPGMSVNVLFADGHVQSIRERISPDQLKALLTRSGGERVDPKDFDVRHSPRPNQGRIVALVVFIVSFLLLLSRRKAKTADVQAEAMPDALAEPTDD